MPRTQLTLLILCLASPAAAGTLDDYIQPRQQLDLAFGQRSYWHPPWRAYLDTWPATRLINGTGLNFNVPADIAEPTARMLATHGIKHARVEIGWGSFRYDDPLMLSDPARLSRTLAALKRYGIRPLLLLNAHHGYPCPIRSIRVRLVNDARQGDTQVTLADCDAVVPEYTGFLNLTDYVAAQVIITSLDRTTGVAKLSRPMLKDLPAGAVELYVLKYQPFSPLALPDGTPNPAGEETMQGWLTYVRGLSQAAKQALGTEEEPDAGFDLEVWNELTFGSNFLSINNYYEPKRYEKVDVLGDILRRTVEYVDSAEADLPGVRVGDGFDNQWPWGAGSTAPVGLHALDKHPYPGWRHFPQDDDGTGAYRLQPLNALGQPDGSVEQGNYFRPMLDVCFPEDPFCAYQTEHIIRDLSPYTTDVYRTLHGRFTHPPGGAPCTMWITESNIGPVEKVPGISREAALWIKGKTTLRYWTCYIHKGVEFLTLFAARDSDQNLGLVKDSFFDYLKVNDNAYPEDDAAHTSPALSATANLMQALAGAQEIENPRPLELRRIEEPEDRIVFAGDGTPEHPTVYNRDCFAFLPFQVNASEFAIPLYVMTRSVFHAYDEALPLGDPTRYDMPPERFILTIENIRGAGAKVSAYDSLRDEASPVEVVERTPDSLVVEVMATDYPRLLTIEEATPGPEILDVRLAPGAGAATLTWRTNVPAVCEVEWGPADGELTQRTQTPQATTHRAVLAGLEAGRVYRYGITARLRDGRYNVRPRWPEDPEGIFTLP